MLIVLAAGLNVHAADLEMADQLRASGKIYAVVAIIALIFLGIVLFLRRIDKRVAKIEKQVNNN
jgi:hypothetical protein